MRRYLTAALATAGLLGGGEARAADYVTLLDWACGADGSAGYVKSSLLQACEMTEGAKSACAVVAGTPFACFDHAASAKTLDCDKGAINFEISGTVGGALGWKVEGTMRVAASYKYVFSGTQCDLTLKSPLPSPSATGGTYVYRAGKATASASMTASGTGYVTFLGGKIFGKNFNETCSRSLSVTGYRTSTASGCTTSPTPSPSASASPSESPTATATASATPTWTPTATPSVPPSSPPSSPTSTPSIAPSPTVFESPTESPTASPVVSASPA